MKKYLNLLFTFFRASAVSDLEYRMNVVVKIIGDVFWYIGQLAVFEVLFRNVDSISGWTLESTRVFMGILFVVDAIWMVLFSENLDRLSDKVRKGELDLLLAKPVNSQFMMSLQKMNTAYLFNLVLACGWLTWALSQLSQPIDPMRIPLLFVLVPCSVAITYSLRFFFAALAVIFTRAENLTYIWYQLYRLGTRPDGVYPPWIRYVILSFLPIAFLASVPARLLLGSPDLYLVAAAMGLASLCLYLTSRFWRFALRFYSSASS
jgi:ABC-2 type transport system permease protein